MSEITEEQVAAGVRSYRGRCLDHGIEWRTTEPQACQQCEEEFTAASPLVDPRPRIAEINDSAAASAEAAPVAAEQPANPDTAKKAKK